MHSSSVFSRGRKQSIKDNDIYSIGRDLVILNVHSNNTVQGEISCLSQVASAVENSLIDSLTDIRGFILTFFNYYDPDARKALQLQLGL